MPGADGRGQHERMQHTKDSWQGLTVMIMVGRLHKATDKLCSQIGYLGSTNICVEGPERHHPNLQAEQ